MIDEKRLIEEINKEICTNCSEEYCLGHCNVRLIEELINNQPKVGEWIPCSERLPKLEEVVLLSVKMDEEPMVLIGELWKSGWTLHCDGYDEEDFEFIAWMPLPPAYKGE